MRRGRETGEVMGRATKKNKNVYAKVLKRDKLIASSSTH
jgi:hypothetical protein